MTYSYVLLKPDQRQTTFFSHLGIVSCICCLPLKATQFNVVDTTGFLKDFGVLKYLFIVVDFLKSCS